MNNDNIFAVVMAGGKGERFWPQSRASHPKQLLSLIGNLTLIEQTVDRLSPFVKPENTIVLTNKDYVAPMQSLLYSLPKENIIGEPVGRDTGPCVALATAIVKSKATNDNPVMLLLPADHVIRNSRAMLAVLKDSCELAEDGSIVTIGVNPTFPSTGYGYIQCGDKCDTSTDTSFFKSKGFKEKPTIEVAENFLKDGSYKWNSGMFVWSAKTVYSAFQEYAPKLAELTDGLEKAARGNDFINELNDIFPSAEKISIDYAIMEKVDNVIVAECSFDWDDVGSWTALRNQIRPEQNNNVVRGLHVGLDSEDCIIVGDSKHLITTVDVKDLIIVHTDDATLVCNAKSAQRIKELVHLLGEKPEMAKFI